MSDFYAGLDVSDRTTAICIIDAAGVVVFQTSVDTTPAAIALALKPYKRMLTRVGQEVGSKSAWLHKELVRKGFPMLCLDARVAHAGLSVQRNKTDKNDALALAKLLRAGWFNEVHVKSDEAMRVRLLLTFRRALKRKAQSLENTLRASIKAFGGQLVGKGEAMHVKLPTRRHDETLIRMGDAILRAKAAMLKELDALEEIIAETAKADPVCRRLMTTPGVGALTALIYKSAVDDPARFKRSRDVGAHFGLTPRRFQSGEADVSGHISRFGDVYARTALYGAAFNLLAHSKSKAPLRVWGLKLREAKGLKYASTACARKLAVTLHRLWVTEQNFDPNLVRKFGSA